jgi:hypothetical protein
MTEVVQRQYESEARSRRRGPAERKGTVDNPVVCVNHMWPLPPSDEGQLAGTQRIRHRWVMGAAARIDTRQAHRSRGEPVHPDPRCKGFLIRDTDHTLRRYRNVMSTPSECIREVENVALLAADVRRKELR